MKHIVKSMVVFGVCTSLMACSTSGIKRGSVVMKMGETAHVSMGKADVSAGDHIQLYQNVCTPAGKAGAGSDRSCRKEEKGHGEITQVLNDDYSVVQFPEGTKFSEGDTVEKHPHQ